ncbi:MAG: Holliday junction DNA helicase RuvA [Bacillus thermozeamaize]|uniref:Putative pre-16S rRNA nuclease n=1 Tax=Bacillus thermozeamaize TaxID=230954 RepID=A0A1Y3PUB5_9BACI|nr:MAG: Holliday junction DNA helicase RuvA [Bacillus thermozeamaize]
MRILALDLGSKRVGVAVSDSLGLTAQGLTVLKRQPDHQLISDIASILEQYDVDEIVVGYPKNMNGTIGPRGREAEAFAEQLRNRFRLPVVLWDERLTTAAAERSLLEADLSRKKRRQVVDQLAAVLILEGYLQARGAKNDG